MNEMNESFWQSLDLLVAEHPLVIDRPRGSNHPRFPPGEVTYPLDYGFLSGTTASDGAGIDVWLGASGDRQVTAIQVTVDLHKRDTEIKIMLGCTGEEITLADRFLNTGWMHAMTIMRPKDEK